MATFTFIANYNGGTFIRQAQAADVLQACRVWAVAVVKNQDIPDLNTAKFLKNVADDMDEFPPAPLDDTPNVWCFTVGSGKAFMLVNIVKTEHVRATKAPLRKTPAERQLAAV